MSATRPFALALAMTASISSRDAPDGKSSHDTPKRPRIFAIERFRRRVERTRMDDDIAGLDESQQQGRDRRHAARESECIVRVFPDRRRSSRISWFGPLKRE